MTLEDIKQSIEAGEPASKSIEKLTQIIEADPENSKGETEESLILRGMRYWSLSQRGKAISDYLAAIRLNPDSQAKTLLQSANAILDFYNKDLYNP